MQQACNAFGVTVVRLVRHGLECALYLPRLYQNGIQTRFRQPAMQPL